MRLSEIGEFGLIQRIQSRMHGDNPRIALGIGDDAAILNTRTGWQTLLTTDTLVEHIHFDLSHTPLEALGWKALASSLSDIAAMGGLPAAALICLGIPDSWSVDRVDQFYNGLHACSEEYHCPVAGGDTVRVPEDSTFTVAILGEVEEGKAVLRSGAKPGDYLCVTGELGNSRTGLDVLTEGIIQAEYAEAVGRFLRPRPRIAEARQIVKYGGITAMIDISDGLISEILHLCNSSHTGCRIFAEQIPLAEAAVRWAKKKDLSPLDFSMRSGEEYELLFTIIPEFYQDFISRNSGGSEFIFKIGEITEYGSGIQMVKNNQSVQLRTEGWDHFIQ